MTRYREAQDIQSWRDDILGRFWPARWTCLSTARVTAAVRAKAASDIITINISLNSVGPKPWGFDPSIRTIWKHSRRKKSVLEQSRLLSPLKRLLELDGCACRLGDTIDGVGVPLVVRRDGKEVLVGTRPGLVTASAHSLARTSRRVVEVLNEHVLRQNLPDEHQLVRGRL